MGDAAIAEALGVSAETARRFESAGVRRRFPPRCYLFLEGDAPSAVYLVEVGMLRVDRTTPSGRKVLFSLATPGDLVGDYGAIDNSPRSATASTLTEARLLVVPADAFRELISSDPEMARAALRRAIQRMRSISDQLVEATARSASARVAARLVRLVDMDAHPTESPFDLKLPITQEELGQWAGLSREGVVKGLAKLRENGLIETGRRRITVLDVDGLRASASKADL